VTEAHNIWSAQATQWLGINFLIGYTLYSYRLYIFHSIVMAYPGYSLVAFCVAAVAYVIMFMKEKEVQRDYIRAIGSAPQGETRYIAAR
jgi:hypothetical protein